MLSVSADVNVNDKLITNQISMIKVPAIPKCILNSIIQHLIGPILYAMYYANQFLTEDSS